MTFIDVMTIVTTIVSNLSGTLMLHTNIQVDYIKLPSFVADSPRTTDRRFAVTEEPLVEGRDDILSDANT